MKITKKILQDIIKEELHKIFEEQEGEPAGGPGISFDIPTETQAQLEPVAGYLLQRLNHLWPSLASQEDFKKLENRVRDLETTANQNPLRVVKIPSDINETKMP